MPLKCHCGLYVLPTTGKCEYECSPFADPAWLRLQAEKRRERDAYRRRHDHWTITVDDHKRMNAAVARFDKLYAHAQGRSKKAAAIKYAIGGRR